MPPAALRCFTGEEYHRLAEVGVLHEDDRAELLNEVISNPMLIGPFHEGSVQRHAFPDAAIDTAALLSSRG
jgi:hypothetical protein